MSNDVEAKYRKYSEMLKKSQKEKEHAVKTAYEQAKFRNELAGKYGGKDNEFIQTFLQMQMARDYREALIPREERIRRDFQDFYLPSDDIYGGATGDDSYGRPRLTDMEKLANSRIGVAGALCTRIPEDAYRNWISWKEIDSDEDVKNRLTKEILRWQLEVDYYNQRAEAGRVASWAGIAFLVSYWPKSKDPAFTKHKTHPDYKEPPPKGVLPNRLQVFDPIRMTPANLTETKLLDYDEEVWEFTGGLFGGAASIHKDRVHVVKLNHWGGYWRGISIFEPIWLTLMMYFNSEVQYVKGLAKWGHQLAKYRTSIESPTATEVNKIISLVDEMRANYIWICGANEDIDFADPKMISGFGEYTEFLKEDISSWAEIPLPYLFGRAVSGAISNAGMVVVERYYMNSVAKFQHKMDDNEIMYHDKLGFKILDNYLRPNWNLALQKTVEQELIEEAMRLDVDLRKEQLKAMKMDLKIKQLQMDLMKEYGLPTAQNEPHEITEGGEGQPKMLPNKSKKEKEDFAKRPININFYNVDRGIPLKPKKLEDYYD